MVNFEKAALAVLDDYFAALNAHDSAGMRDSFHFPHYRIAGGRMQVFETAADYSMKDFHKLWEQKLLLLMPTQYVCEYVQAFYNISDGEMIQSKVKERYKEFLEVHIHFISNLTVLN